MRNSTANQPSVNTGIRHPSPFIEIEGRLFYREECKTPQFLNSSFITTLFEQPVIVDHFVLLFPSTALLMEYAHRLVDYGAQILEGPGQWPQDFCTGQAPFPDDLTMYFLSALMPSQGILVLAAPHAPDDQLDRLLQGYGLNVVHHVALRVDDVDAGAIAWQNNGFMPVSPHPQNDGCLCQWLFRNSAGQMIELICRQCDGGATFSCENIAGLRRSENPM
ncbi:MAG TPA: hypothetical protein V6C78_01765 [Crinalium sp.]